MADLKTKYMGLELKNPVIVGSCNLSKSIDGIKRLEDAGAGGIVLKSLFEEQIQINNVEQYTQYISPSWHYEAFDYVSRMGMELGPDEYLNLIEKAKTSTEIPIIASLNCVTGGWWGDYARKIESAGADALEVNIAYLVIEPARKAEEVEREYYTTFEYVREAVKIPVAVKLGPFFTSFANLASGLVSRGADGLVLFNRFYQFDIDIDNLKPVAVAHLSNLDEISLPLRWIALLYGILDCDLAATTGVHDGLGVFKMILAGATVVQVVSALYKNGIDYISTIIKEFERLMDEKGYKSTEDMRGIVSRSESEKPELFERLQYIKALVGME